jgi:hypothetical protein
MSLKLTTSAILLAGLSFASPSWADPIRHCEIEGEKFGNGKGKDLISQSCLKLFKGSAKPQAIKSSPGGKINVFGHKNIIFIKEGKQVRVIAGEYTELEDIVAVAIDEANQEIAVLSGKGDVSFFSSHITGNVAPLRVLKHKDLGGSVDIALNTKRNELLVLNPSDQRIYFFSRLANKNAPENKRKSEILKVIDGLTGHESISVDEKQQRLFSLDQSQRVVHVYPLSSGTKPSESSRLALPQGVSALKIEYRVSEEKLILTTTKGDVPL